MSINLVDKIDISVSLCTYNRVEMLRDSLESLIHQQTHGTFSYEIVLIDDGSTDETSSLVRKVSDGSKVPIRYFREERVGVAAARNKGVTESRGEWIAFIDDDEIAEACWLKELLCEAKQSGAACVGGPVVAHFLSSSPDARMKTTLGLLGHKPVVTTNMRWYDKFFHNYVPGTGNALVKRDIFGKIGLFDTTLLYGEDMDFFRRLHRAGFKVSNNSRALVKHIIPAFRLDPVYLRRLSKLAGQTLACLDKREWGYSALLLFSGARISYVLFKRAPRLLVGLARGDRESVLDHTLIFCFTASYIYGSIIILFGLLKRLALRSVDQIRSN
jgi:glycosyltransferase involved in cell wall biosynthesis